MTIAVDLGRKATKQTKLCIEKSRLMHKFIKICEKYVTILSLFTVNKWPPSVFSQTALKMKLSVDFQGTGLFRFVVPHWCILQHITHGCSMSRFPLQVKVNSWPTG